MTNTDEIWREYKARPTPELRDRLAEHYLPLVNFLARRLARTMPSSIALDDLVSDGTLGLLDAIEKFDPGQGFKFSTYASRRVRGAMLDGLRQGDWLPRQVRQQVSAVDRAQRSLEADLGCAPTEKELADELGLSVHELRSVFAHPSSRVASLEQLISDGDGDTTSFAETLASTDDTPGEAYDITELLERLARAIGRLDERERSVLALYYLDGLSLARVAKALHISESRVQEVYLGGLVRLRALMVNNGKEAA